MSIANGKFGSRGYRYFHFDANAGSGWNDIIGVPGSPSVFWELADQYLKDMPFSAFFAERDRRLAAKLLASVPARHAANSFVFQEDNEDVLKVFAEFIRQRDRPEYAVGTVIVDPNGWFYRNKDGIGPPVSGLVEFAMEFKRIDIALNLNCRFYRMAKGHGIDNFPNLRSAHEIFGMLSKNHWLVSLATPGGNEYLLAVGRNISAGEHKALGLHLIASDEGREIMNRIEGGRQGRLFDGRIPNLSRVSEPPHVQSGEGGGHAEDQLSLPLREESDGGASS